MMRLMDWRLDEDPFDEDEDDDWDNADEDFGADDDEEDEDGEEEEVWQVTPRMLDFDQMPCLH